VNVPLTGNRPRDVGGVALILGAGVDHDEIALFCRPTILHVMQLRPIHARSNDRAVRRACAAEAEKRVLDGGLQLVLVRWNWREHGRAVTFRADFRCLLEQRDLGRAFFRAQLVHQWMRVLHDDPGMPPGEPAHEHATARETVVPSEIGVLEVVQCVEGKTGAGERVDDTSQRREGACLQVVDPAHGRGVGTPAVVECRSGLGRREKDRRGADALYHDHNHRRVGLVEVREIMEGRKLIEGPEIGNRRAAAERDDDTAVDPLGERVTARRELALGDLRRQQ